LYQNQRFAGEILLPEREELQSRLTEIFCEDQTMGKMKTPLECGAFRGFGYAFWA
jgi:hypothetical protein